MTLSDGDVERVARRVVELLGERREGVGVVGLVDAKALASRLGVDVKWVREHAELLGVVRLGVGSRPRLRFDVEVATGVFRARSGGVPPPVSVGVGGGPVVRPRRRRIGAS